MRFRGGPPSRLVLRVPYCLRWIKIANIFPDTIVTGLKKTGEKMIHYALRMKLTQRVGHPSIGVWFFGVGAAPGAIIGGAIGGVVGGWGGSELGEIRY